MARRSVVLRAPAALVEKVDEYARWIEKATGAKITRGQGVEALLRRGLAALKPTRLASHAEHVAAHMKAFAERKR